MITIYHNTRCSKSRAGLAYLDEKGVDYRVREYLKEPFSFDELKRLIRKTGLKASDVIRREEAFYKEQIKGKTLSEDELIEAMVKEPRLIQRPLVEKEEKAVLARPAENIDLLF